MPEPERRYRAFISYSHRDKAVAAWVQAALEHYHVPPKLVGRETALGPVPARLHPLFRDRDELPASADLGDELMAALQNSLFLIVICSPNAALSRWVGEEVLNFKRMHGEGRVLALICGGEPGGEEGMECFPTALQYRIGADGELSDVRAEPIAADIRPGGDGKRLARTKLVAALTGVRLDDLIQRDEARRIRRLTGIAIASATGMVLALGLALYANSQRIVANEQRSIAERESAAARATADYLVDTFAIADPVKDNPRTITALTILDRSAQRARRELAKQPDIQIRLIDTVARAYTNLGLYDEAREALEQSRPTIDALGPQGVGALLSLAELDFRESNLDGALATLRLAEQRLAARSTGNPDQDSQLRAKVQAIRAYTLYEKNDLRGALAAYDQSLAYYKEAREAKADSLATIYNNRGLLLTSMGRYSEAAASLTEARRLHIAVSGADSLDVGLTTYAMADNAYSAGDLPVALERIKAALAIYDRVLDPDHPRRAYAMMLEGQILRDMKRPADAAGVLADAVAIFKAAFGKPHYQIGIAEVYEALALADTGATDRALRILDDAKHNYDIGYGQLHPNHGDLLVNRATILAKARRLPEARRDCAAGLVILDRLMDKADSLLAQSHELCAAMK